MPFQPFRAWGWTFLLALISVAPAVGQNTVGEISGYVRDSSGAALPGVDVRLVFPDIGVERSTQTNAGGYYVLPSLPNGRADLTAELSGFQRFVRKGLKVELNARTRVDITLALGAMSESIEVKAKEPVISSSP